MSSKLSPIQFSMPVLQQCEFTINPAFIDAHKQSNEGGVFLPIKIDKQYGDAIGKDYPVSMRVHVGGKTEEYPFYICVEMSAIFSIQTDVSDGLKEQFLTVNALAVLYSYIRPIIASLTSQSIFPQYNLPFMDFTKKV